MSGCQITDLQVGRYMDERKDGATHRARATVGKPEARAVVPDPHRSISRRLALRVRAPEHGDR